MSTEPEDLIGLYDRDPDRFRREVENLRDKAILPPRSSQDALLLPPSEALARARRRHRVSVDAELLLSLLILVERTMTRDGLPPLGPGPYDRDREDS